MTQVLQSVEKLYQSPVPFDGFQNFPQVAAALNDYRVALHTTVRYNNHSASYKTTVEYLAKVLVNASRGELVNITKHSSTSLGVHLCHRGVCCLALTEQRSDWPAEASLESQGSWEVLPHRHQSQGGPHTIEQESPADNQEVHSRKRQEADHDFRGVERGGECPDSRRAVAA